MAKLRTSCICLEIIAIVQMDTLERLNKLNNSENAIIWVQNGKYGSFTVFFFGGGDLTGIICIIWVFMNGNRIFKNYWSRTGTWECYFSYKGVQQKPFFSLIFRVLFS